MAEPSLTLLMAGGLRAHHNGMRKLMSIVAMTMPLLTGSAQAVEIANLYGGQAIVTGIFEPERTRGLRQVLLDVLVKVSAEPKLIDDPRVQPLLDRAKDFVTSYEYEDRMKGTPVRDEQGTRDRPHDLRIKFDPAKIDVVLAELGLRPWSSDRPILIAHISIEYPGSKFSLMQDNQFGLGQREALEAAATRRGMKVILPDAAAKPPYMGSLEPPEALPLLARMRWQPESASWNTQWTVVAGKQIRIWIIETPSFDEAFRNGVGEAAAALAGRR
jgi:hypothetical protein